MGSFAFALAGGSGAFGFAQSNAGNSADAPGQQKAQSACQSIIDRQTADGTPASTNCAHTK